MSSKVYVLNKNVHPLKEMFKGEEVHIAAQDFWRDKKGNKKAMDIYEANDYRGQYAPVPFDGSGKMLNDPRYFKMIEMIPVEDVATEVGPSVAAFKCMAKECKHVSPSPEELEAHTNKHHPHAEKLILPDVDATQKHKKEKVA